MRRGRLAIATFCLATSMLWPAQSALSCGGPIIESSGPGKFAGSWDVIKAVPGSWIDAAKDNTPDSNKEIAWPAGDGRIIFMEEVVQGPRSLRLKDCQYPTYQIEEVIPQDIFESVLADAPISPDAKVLAKELGHDGQQITHLGLHCVFEEQDAVMDFYLLSKDLAVFELNNKIYTIKRNKL